MRYILSIFLFISVLFIQAQTISKTDFTYDINQTVNGVDYYYYFNKGKKDTFINLKIMSFNINSPTKKLCDEASMLVPFYTLASKEIKIDIWNMNVDYPLQYEDVLAKQIDVFINDTTWQNYYKKYKSDIKNNYTNLDYKLIATIMKDRKVYECLETELNKLNYSIGSFGLEKIGFLDIKYFPKMKAKLLKTYPYTEQQLKTVPIPYMVYLGINKLK